MNFDGIGGAVGIATGVLALLRVAWSYLKGEAVSPFKMKALKEMAEASRDHIVKLSATVENQAASQRLTELKVDNLTDREDERHNETKRRIDGVETQVNNLRDRETNRNHDERKR